MSDLAQRSCEPCRGGTPPLRGDRLQELRAQLHDDWQVVGEHHLERTWRTRDFRPALELTNRIGELAEREQHHPDLELGWGRVKVVLFTHKIDGLSDNDFILAAKIDALS